MIEVDFDWEFIKEMLWLIFVFIVGYIGGRRK